MGLYNPTRKSKTSAAFRLLIHQDARDAREVAYGSPGCGREYTARPEWTPPPAWMRRKAKSAPGTARLPAGGKIADGSERDAPMVLRSRSLRGCCVPKRTSALAASPLEKLRLARGKVVETVHLVTIGERTFQRLSDYHIPVGRAGASPPKTAIIFVDYKVLYSVLRWPEEVLICLLVLILVACASCFADLLDTSATCNGAAYSGTE